MVMHRRTPRTAVSLTRNVPSNQQVAVVYGVFVSIPTKRSNIVNSQQNLISTRSSCFCGFRSTSTPQKVYLVPTRKLTKYCEIFQNTWCILCASQNSKFNNILSVSAVQHQCNIFMVPIINVSIDNVSIIVNYR